MLDHVGQLLNNYSTGFVLLPIALILSAVYLKNLKKWFSLWSIFLVMQGIIWILKFIIDSPRPIGNHTLTNPSFPSGVAADAGFIATYLSLIYPKYWILFHGAGIGVALLRLYVGAHFAIDIIAGYLIGVLMMWTLNKLIRFQTSHNSVYEVQEKVR